MNPLFHTEFSISDSLKNVRKSVLIYETIIIAHAAAYVDDPVEQGYFGVFEVFVDTVVICTLTALIVLIGAGDSIQYGVAAGAELTIKGFTNTYGGWVSVVTAIAMCCFAFSTILGWGLIRNKMY